MTAIAARTVVPVTVVRLWDRDFNALDVDLTDMVCDTSDLTCDEDRAVGQVEVTAPIDSPVGKALIGHIDPGARPAEHLTCTAAGLRWSGRFAGIRIDHDGPTAPPLACATYVDTAAASRFETFLDSLPAVRL